MDNWITGVLGARLRSCPDPLVVDLGYGSSPVTVLELSVRLRRVRPDIRVVGLEIDPARVAAALPFASTGVTFERGGFELAGHRPVLVRAANVLRQYSEEAALSAWSTVQSGLAPDGVLVEGTCDELGRIGSWVLLDASGPSTVTFACRVSSLSRPSDLAERLPKALIHRNVPGSPVHSFFRDFDRAWDAAAPFAVFGPRQRWMAACAALASAWPADHARSRYGELTVAWSALSG